MKASLRDLAPLLLLFAGVLLLRYCEQTNGPLPLDPDDHYADDCLKKGCP